MAVIVQVPVVWTAGGGEHRWAGRASFVSGPFCVSARFRVTVTTNVTLTLSPTFASVTPVGLHS
jgi:hypothetical protein